jgi:hypothetical protein
MDGVSKLREPKGRVRSLSDDERKAPMAEPSDPTLHLFVVVALQQPAELASCENSLGPMLT